MVLGWKQGNKLCAFHLQESAAQMQPLVQEGGLPLQCLADPLRLQADRQA